MSVSRFRGVKEKAICAWIPLGLCHKLSGEERFFFPLSIVGHNCFFGRTTH